MKTVTFACFTKMFLGSEKFTRRCDRLHIAVTRLPVASISSDAFTTRELTMTNFKLAPTLISLAATAMAFNASIGTAKAASQDWDKDWTALTVSNSGAWGTYTSASRIDAMIGAMAQCRENAGIEGSGCGSRVTTVRAGWSAAYDCGSETFIVTAGTFADARVAAINREIELKQIERIDIGDCRPLVVIGPDGQPASHSVLSQVIPLIPEPVDVADFEKLQ
jgi:hypothetical protein